MVANRERWGQRERTRGGAASTHVVCKNLHVLVGCAVPPTIHPTMYCRHASNGRAISLCERQTCRHVEEASLTILENIRHQHSHKYAAGIVRIWVLKQRTETTPLSREKHSRKAIFHATLMFSAKREYAFACGRSWATG